MSYQEEDHPGIPTRAIHEAYLDMHRALKSYRSASDAGGGELKNSAHGELQNAVLTCFQLLRPHLRHDLGSSDYWNGEAPSYPPGNRPPEPEDGVAVLAWQTHRNQAQLNGQSPEEIDTLREWHDSVGLSDSLRLVGVTPTDYGALVTYHSYTMGLKHLDNWETTFREHTTDVGGMLAGKKTTTYSRNRVTIEKLTRAANELSEAANRLGALSQFDESAPRTEITDDLMEEVEAWRQRKLT